MAAETLKHVRETGWRAGFQSLLAKEYQHWWGTKRWLKNGLVWLLIVNGMVFLPSLIATVDRVAKQQSNPYEMGLTIMVTMLAMAGGIGAVVSLQDAIIGERQTGTAAWVLSKPASRTAFVLAKFQAGAVSYVSLAILLQAAIGYLQVFLWSGKLPPTLPFLGSVGALTLHTLFYLAFTLMLGTFFQSRGPVIGSGLGFLFAGQIFPGILKKAALAFPWTLGDVASALALGQKLPTETIWPVACTAAWTVLCLVVAVKRFGREEL